MADIRENVIGKIQGKENDKYKSATYDEVDTGAVKLEIMNVKGFCIKLVINIVTS